MSTSVFFATLLLMLATILIVFGMRYYAQIQQTKAHKANDEALRQMAATLNDVRDRLVAVEKILKDVG